MKTAEPVVGIMGQELRLPINIEVTSTRGRRGPARPALWEVEGIR
jgi:hypothetical protein